MICCEMFTQLVCGNISVPDCLFMSEYFQVYNDYVSTGDFTSADMYQLIHFSHYMCVDAYLVGLFCCVYCVITAKTEQLLNELYACNPVVTPVVT